MAINKNLQQDAQTANNSGEFLHVQNAEEATWGLTGKKGFTTAQGTWKTQTSCTVMGNLVSRMWKGRNGKNNDVKYTQRV